MGGGGVKKTDKKDGRFFVPVPKAGPHSVLKSPKMQIWDLLKKNSEKNKKNGSNTKGETPPNIKLKDVFTFGKEGKSNLRVQKRICDFSPILSEFHPIGQTSC